MSCAHCKLGFLSSLLLRNISYLLRVAVFPNPLPFQHPTLCFISFTLRVMVMVILGNCFYQLPRTLLYQPVT